MSLECSECERDLRGPHDPSCSRFDRTGHCEGCCDEDCPGLPISPEVKAVRTQAILWAVEWTLKYTTPREDWPISWDWGWPGIKAQALLDAPDADALAALNKEP